MSAQNIEDVYPVSPVQEGMLFHSLYQVGGGVYVTQFTCLLESLDVSLFEQSWQQAVDRHSILRTAFVWKSVEKPLQLVGRRVKISIPCSDLRGLSPDEQEGRVGSYLREDRERGFDVAKAPLMRFMLFQVGADSYRFVWSHHHLLLDGWATAVLLNEVLSFYDGQARAEPPRLPSPRPYRDYINWLQSQDMAEAEDYWRKTLSGFAAATRFNVDRSRPSSNGAGENHSRQRRLSREMTARLQALARQQQLTLNTVVQGAWALLLSRYSGERDVLFGAVVSGRPPELAGVEAMVGLFINTLPVRARVDESEGVVGWLRRLQAEQARARQYEHSPLVEVQRWSEVAGGTPLFDCYIVVENYPIDEALKRRTGGLVVKNFASLERSSYPLTIAVIPGAELTIQMHFDTDRFDGPVIERMLGHLTTLLEEFADDPDRSLARVSMLTRAERRQLLVDWNAKTNEPPSTQLCIHQLVEEQVSRCAHEVAVVDEDRRLTYGELNERANRLARHLRGIGVGPESRVGLCVGRSADAVVGLLGILKAGGVYVPLDPQYPRERLQFMIEDAGLAVLLTQLSLSDALPPQHQAQVVYIDAGWRAVARQSADNLPNVVSPGNLAYIIYTSGSTGTPKGIGIPHEAIVNHCLDIRKEFEIEAADRVLQFASLSFDVSLEQVLPTLMAGARLVLRGDSFWNASDFARVLEAEELSVVNFPTAYWHQLTQEWVDGGGSNVARRLRLVIIGGDTILPEAVRLWQSTPMGTARLINAYGPTEATITSAAFTIPQGFCDVASPERIPIGRPVGARPVYVLDGHGHPCPVGVPGELHIGGPLLARSYLGDAAQTAEKFIPDAFSARPGGRLYRTGDLVRYLPGGDIEFLGRVDFQLKVRGFRIELGEIEITLRRHPAVRDAVVMAREGEAGDKQIVAYVASDRGAELTAGMLRDHLREWLPDYMLPAAFVMLDALPLTVNGKVDRQALLNLRQESQPGPAPADDAPHSPVEEAVAGIWEEVLEVERVSPQANFFDLGGHSLLATQIISRLRKKFKVELPFRTLFEEPTVRAMAAAIERQTQASHEPPSSSAAPESPASSIRLVPRDGNVPLSFGQERLWFLDQLDPSSPSYLVAAAVRLSGALNRPAFERALNELVRRHEVLRTCFGLREGRPVQLIAPSLPVPLLLVDLSHLPEAGREEEARRLAAEEARRPFDLSRLPLLRASLVRLSDSEHLALLTLHHIVTDGWSMGVLVREVAALYEAFSTGGGSPLPELPIQYADYAAWQREFLQGEVLEEQLSYWKEALEGAPWLELPTDRPRPAAQTYRGAHHQFAIGGAEWAGVGELARAEGATPFMVLLAAFYVLLGRHSGQRDVSVGTPVAGRTRTESEGLIGLFVNTLVLRAAWGEAENFRGLLRGVRARVLEAQAHQELPFERLVEELQPERSLSRTPLFQVMFVMQNSLLPSLKLAGVEMRAVGVESKVSKFDLTLEVEEKEGGVEGAFEYSTDLFDAATVESMASHYLNVLRLVTSEPDVPVSGVEMLSPRERHQLLHEWNQTSSPYPRETCVHELFEAQAHRTPDATALVCGDEQLSYGELNRRANRLARHLRALGAGPEQLVAILMERSAEMVVALLAVLKSGAAYLPLDAANPEERLRWMLADSEAGVILTQEALAGRVRGHDCEVVVVDAQRGDEEIAARGGEDLEPWASPDNLAYVIYTSGSTGTPKGVMIHHRPLVNYLHWASSAYAAGSGSGSPLHSPLAFDLCLTSLFPPLLTGSRLSLVPEGAGVEPLASALSGGPDFSLVKLTPAHLEALSHCVAEEAASRSARCLVIGGEALRWEALRWWREHAPPMRLVNEYGPTEAVVGCCVYEAAEGIGKTGAVPIGRGIANARLYVLDGRGRPAGVGVRGEIYIGGEGVGRGYHARPALTAERFVPDPYSGEAGARMYRTGDVGRWSAGGVLEYLGREDGQVKVRGYRVEVGEVEGALRGVGGVRECAVVAREGAGGAQELVGYVVGEEWLSSEVVRAALRGRLPEYMVPGRVEVIAEMPLTPNGKLDRRALSNLEIGPLTSGADFVAPRTPTEVMLARIWGEMLGVKEVGVHDNFFELGGHSILATQVLSRVRDVSQVRVSLRRVFETPTIAGLAAAIDESQPSQSNAIGRFERPSGETEFPLSFAQERLWFLDQLRPGEPFYNIPVALSLKGRLNPSVIEKVLNEIIKRHEVLRTYFREREGTPAQVIVPRYTLKLPVIDFSGLPAGEREQEARRLAAEEARRPFDLSRLPLLRASLVRLSDSEHLALLTLHHIVTDGWSMGVLVREVAALYEAFSTGGGSPLPELPIQYADYAAWQREFLQGEVLEEQLSYWRQALEGAPQLELPADRPRPAAQSFRGAYEPVFVPLSLAEKLRALGEAEGVTPFMTLLAVFNLMLSYYAKQDDIVVGTDVANRDRSEVENLLGFFINQLVLRTDLSGDPTFRELLGRVRAVTLDAYTHQETPFDLLVDAVKPERTLSHAPLFQSKFVLQSTPQETLELPGLTLKLLGADYVSAKLDLTLLLEETPEGFRGNIEYSTDLFERATAVRLAKWFVTLLEEALAQPDRGIEELKSRLRAADRRGRDADDGAIENLQRKKLRSIRPKKVELVREELVVKDLLRGGEAMPLVVRPLSEEVDAVSWAASNRPAIEKDLREHGAILFRDFKIDLSTQLESFARSLCSELFNENGEHPRELVSGNVYTPVFYPPDQHLLWHNENSFNYRWPTKIWFACVQPAREGGETPVVDSRKVFARLSPGVRDSFMKKGVMYTRNYDKALGLEWQTVFQTTDRAQVEKYCRLNSIEFEWKANGELRTRCVRPAAIRHPQTGVWSWFNQAQHWHTSCLDPVTRESMLRLFAEEDLPRNCYYGDGSPIEDFVMMEILEVYRELEVSFPWQKGDIMMLDNVLTAHARNRFAGTRKLLVALGDMLSYGEVADSPVTL